MNIFRIYCRQIYIESFYDYITKWFTFRVPFKMFTNLGEQYFEMLLNEVILFKCTWQAYREFKT